MARLDCMSMAFYFDLMYVLRVALLAPRENEWMTMFSEATCSAAASFTCV